MRHAKSSWVPATAGSAPPSDKARALSPRGLRDAPRMAAWMVAEALRPNLILCSTAVRARQTLEHVGRAILADGGRITFRDDLYLAEAAELLAIIRQLPDPVGHVMFVGHDPGLHDLAHQLSGSGDIALRRLLAQKFPTAGVAVIDFATERWSDVATGVGKLRHFMAPKRIADE